MVRYRVGGAWDTAVGGAYRSLLPLQLQCSQCCPQPIPVGPCSSPRAALSWLRERHCTVGEEGPYTAHTAQGGTTGHDLVGQQGGLALHQWVGVCMYCTALEQQAQALHCDGLGGPAQ